LEAADRLDDHIGWARDRGAARVLVGVEASAWGSGFVRVEVLQQRL
jgi:hypothetical protein